MVITGESHIQNNGALVAKQKDRAQRQNGRESTIDPTDKEMGIAKTHMDESVKKSRPINSK